MHPTCVGQDTCRLPQVTACRNEQGEAVECKRERRWFPVRSHSGEAFINEVAEAAARDASGQWMTGRPGVDLLRDLADTLDEIEDAQGTVGLNTRWRARS
jgi:hypothetical protein